MTLNGPPIYPGHPGWDRAGSLKDLEREQSRAYAKARDDLRRLLDDARSKSPETRLSIAIAWCCDDPDEMLALSGFYPF